MGVRRIEFSTSESTSSTIDKLRGWIFGRALKPEDLLLLVLFEASASVSKETLHMVYYGIFSSLLTYGSQVWGQQSAVTKKLRILQKKVLRIMYFQPPRTSTTPLFKMSNILKINYHISLQTFS